MYRKTDPAIEWLSQLIAPLSPEEFLSKQAASLLAKSGQSEPPFNPQKALPSTVKRVELAKLSRDGMLIPVQGGFIIKINSLKSLVRQNFTCAHEIGHTFFYDVTGERPWRPYKSMSTYWGEEFLCHAFARELLMPEEQVKQDIAISNERNLKMIMDLAAKYMVSPEVTARRLMLDLSEFQSSILLFKEPNVTKGKAVWWFYGSTLKRYLRKGEKAVFKQVIEAVNEGPESQILEHILASNKTVSIEHYQAIPNSRLMTLITFKRDVSGTSPSV